MPEVTDSAYTSYLPPLYSRWLGELLKQAIPDETLATCGDCAMCVKGKGQQTVFHPDVKCCSYIPIVPNFLLGRILADEDPAAAKGRETMVKRLETGISMTPLGVAASPTEDVLYRHVTQNQGFGKQTGIRCPHLMAEGGGTCGIYKHRNAVCATYHCKFVRGAVGQDFWSKTRNLLLRVEDLLSRWCVLRLHADPKSLPLLFHAEEAMKADAEKSGRLSGVMAPEHAKKMWGRWHGKEKEFYRECVKSVERLSWKEVVAICGPEVEANAHLVAHAFKNLLSEEIPKALKLGPFNVTYIAPDFAAVTTYSPLDPISLPKPLVDVLHRFDGRPTKEVVKEISDKDEIELDPGLISKLVDYRVLVDATE